MNNFEVILYSVFGALVLSCVCGVPYILYVWKLMGFVHLSRRVDTMVNRLEQGQAGQPLTQVDEPLSNNNNNNDGNHHNHHQNLGMQMVDTSNGESEGSVDEHVRQLEMKYAEEDKFIMLDHKLVSSGSADPSSGATGAHISDPAARSSVTAVKLADNRSSLFKNYYTGQYPTEESIKLDPRQSYSNNDVNHDILTSHSHIPQMTPTGGEITAALGPPMRRELVNFDSQTGFHTIEIPHKTLRRLRGGGTGTGTPLTGAGVARTEATGMSVTDDFHRMLNPELRWAGSEETLGVPDPAHVTDVSGGTNSTTNTSTNPLTSAVDFAKSWGVRLAGSTRPPPVSADAGVTGTVPLAAARSPSSRMRPPTVTGAAGSSTRMFGPDFVAGRMVEVTPHLGAFTGDSNSAPRYHSRKPSELGAKHSNSSVSRTVVHRRDSDVDFLTNPLDAQKGADRIHGVRPKPLTSLDVSGLTTAGKTVGGIGLISSGAGVTGVDGLSASDAAPMATPVPTDFISSKMKRAFDDDEDEDDEDYENDVKMQHYNGHSMQPIDTASTSAVSPTALSMTAPGVIIKSAASITTSSDGQTLGNSVESAANISAETVSDGSTFITDSGVSYSEESIYVEDDADDPSRLRSAADEMRSASSRDHRHRGHHSSSKRHRRHKPTSTKETDSSGIRKSQHKSRRKKRSKKGRSGGKHSTTARKKGGERGGGTVVASSSSRLGPSSGIRGRHEKKDSRRISKTVIGDLLRIRRDNLQFDRLLGKGKFGKVHLAMYTDSTTKERFQVAVKTFKADETDRTSWELFVKELRVASMLPPTPNLLKIIGFGEKPLMIVTEFMNYGSMETAVSLKHSDSIRRSLTFKQLTQMLADAANGIALLHENQILHRDIAARNLLLEIIIKREKKSGRQAGGKIRCAVCDFGLSRVAKDSAAENNYTESHVGPLKWMPEESIRRRVYNEKTDAYAFGILMWEVLAGIPPYPNKNTMAAAVEVLTRNVRPIIPKWWPHRLSFLMQMCWQNNPIHRPIFSDIYQYLHITQALFIENPDPATLASAAGLSSTTTDRGGGTPEPTLIVDSAGMDDSATHLPVESGDLERRCNLSKLEPYPNLPLSMETPDKTPYYPGFLIDFPKLCRLYNPAPDLKARYLLSKGDGRHGVDFLLMDDEDARSTVSVSGAGGGAMTSSAISSALVPSKAASAMSKVSPAMVKGVSVAASSSSSAMMMSPSSEGRGIGTPVTEDGIMERSLARIGSDDLDSDEYHSGGTTATFMTRDSTGRSSLAGSSTPIAGASDLRLEPIVSQPVFIQRDLAGGSRKLTGVGIIEEFDSCKLTAPGRRHSSHIVAVTTPDGTVNFPKGFIAPTKRESQQSVIEIDRAPAPALLDRSTIDKLMMSGRFNPKQLVVVSDASGEPVVTRGPPIDSASSSDRRRRRRRRRQRNRSVSTSAVSASAQSTSASMSGSSSESEMTASRVSSKLLSDGRGGGRGAGGSHLEDVMEAGESAVEETDDDDDGQLLLLDDDEEDDEQELYIEVKPIANMDHDTDFVDKHGFSIVNVERDGIMELDSSESLDSSSETSESMGGDSTEGDTTDTTNATSTDGESGLDEHLSPKVTTVAIVDTSAAVRDKKSVEMTPVMHHTHHPPSATISSAATATGVGGSSTMTTTRIRSGTEDTTHRVDSPSSKRAAMTSYRSDSKSKSHQRRVKHIRTESEEKDTRGAESMDTVRVSLQESDFSSELRVLAANTNSPDVEIETFSDSEVDSVDGGDDKLGFGFKYPASHRPSTNL